MDLEEGLGEDGAIFYARWPVEKMIKGSEQ